MSATGARLVVGVDGSEDSRLSVDWAVTEARLRAAPVHLVHALDWPMVDVPPTDAQWRQLEAGAHALVESERARAERTGDAAVTAEVAPLGPAKSLVDASGSAQLIVVGARGHGVAYDVWVGSISMHVTRHAHCPVAVVRTPASATQSRIVVGVDASAGGALALRWAMAEGQLRGVAVTVAHACPDHPADTFGSPAEVRKREAYRMREGERMLERMLAEHGRDHPAVKVDIEAIPVHPTRLLTDASEFAALVVVGARGLDGPTGPRLGSVSQGVLHHARCPVIVVR